MPAALAVAPATPKTLVAALVAAAGTRWEWRGLADQADQQLADYASPPIGF